MTVEQFNEIKKLTKQMQHTSLEYIDFSEIETYDVIVANESIAVMLGYNEEAKCYEYHWSANRVEELIQHLDCTEPFFISFIPKEWMGELETAGLQIRNAWHDYFMEDLTSIKLELSEDMCFLTTNECNQASEITLACKNQTRGFTGQTKEWFEVWISEENEDVDMPAVLSYRLATGEIVGVLCTGLYGSDTSRIVWIREIAVHPNYQNQGIARKLISGALSYGRANGAVKAFLAADEQNEAGIHLYTSVGFVASKEDSQIDMIKE